ncbi:MAG: hypothetical protein ACI85S_000728 [Pseudohongiellaceae bacterium]|jgi:hypothetical protein
MSCSREFLDHQGLSFEALPKLGDQGMAFADSINLRGQRQ